MSTNIINRRTIYTPALAVPGAGGGGGDGPFTIDGAAVTFSSFATVTSQALPPISTHFTNTVLFLLAEINAAQGATVTDTAGLTWVRRTTSFSVSTPNTCELWSAKAPAILTNNVVTINYTGTNGFLSASLFAFSGANNTSPYDPVGAGFNDGLSPLSITTTNPTTIVIFGARTGTVTGDTISWSGGGGNLLSNTDYFVSGWKTGPGASGSQNAIPTTGPGNGSVIDAITV